MLNLINATRPFLYSNSCSAQHSEGLETNGFAGSVVLLKWPPEQIVFVILNGRITIVIILRAIFSSTLPDGLFLFEFSQLVALFFNCINKILIFRRPRDVTCNIHSFHGIATK